MAGAFSSGNYHPVTPACAGMTAVVAALRKALPQLLQARLAQQREMDREGKHAQA